MKSQKKSDLSSRMRLKRACFVGKATLLPSQMPRYRRYLILSGVIGLALSVVLFPSISRTLTDPLLVHVPTRIVGIATAPADGKRSDIRSVAASPNVTTAKKQNKAASGQKLALAELEFAGGFHNVELSDDGKQEGYLPSFELNNQNVSAGTIITIPASQGRLLRFDGIVESVFIADPEIADIRMVESDLIYVYGKTVGLTNLMAVSAPIGKGADVSGVKQQLTASALLRVVVDQTPAKEARQEWSPDTPLDITIFGRRTAVRGGLRDIDEAVDAANLAETYSAKDQPPINKTTLKGSNQINIRVRFAEAVRSDLRKFGIDWNVGAGAGNILFGLEKSGGTQDPNLGIGVKGDYFNVELLIEALQANGTLRILAEPNLTAVTGETASFLAGGEVPIPVASGQNGESISVEYKSFGVSLSFTPTLVTGNRIALRIKPEVSSIASQTNFAVQGFNLPAFTVRRAETTVEMASGQTFAIAGLFQSEITRDVRKIPILGDVPILQKLFQSKRYQRNETELVILITPYLVKPVSDKSLTTPLEAANTSLLETDDFIGLHDSLKDATPSKSLK